HSVSVVIWSSVHDGYQRDALPTMLYSLYQWSCLFFDLLGRFLQLSKYWGFSEVTTNEPCCEGDQQGEPEDDAPTPCQEHFLWHKPLKSSKSKGGHDGAGRCDHHHGGGETSTGARPCSFCPQGCRARLFCACSQALYQAKDEQENRSKNADGRVGRNNSDEECGSTHDGQGGNQYPFT